MNIKEFFNSKRAKYGAVSTAISLVFLALIIVVNVVASVLTDKFPLTVDLTPNSAFKLTQESIDFVKGLQKPVGITVLAEEKNFENSGDLYYSQVKSVIDQYAQYNKNITLSYVDIVTNPTFTAKYENLNLNYGDVLIESGTKQRKVSVNDMFNIKTNQYTYQQSIESSKAEQVMTAAIMGVTSDDNVKVAFLNGHDEVEMAALRELLVQNNFEVSDVNLTSEEIDPSIDVLFMVAPSRDPDPEILKKLDAYLENGQKFGKTLIYAANAGQPATPNLDAFLADWGIKVGGGAVFETDASKIFNYNQYFCIVDYSADDYRDEISDTLKVSMPLGRPLETLFTNQSGHETSVLLSYSDTSGIYPADAPEGWQPGKDDLHETPALIRSTYMRYEGTTPLRSNVFVASAASSFEQLLLGSKSFANADYFLNMLNGVTERKDVISIAPKELGGSELGINQFQSMLIALVLVILLPVLIIIIGLVIWLRRRHK